MVGKHIPLNSYAEQWDAKGLHEEVMRVLALDLPVEDWAKEEGIADEAIRERIIEASDKKMAEKEQAFTPEIMRMAEKGLLLQLLDHSWKDHLLSLDHLRQGINLRAYGQRDPLNEYKREAFELFEGMLVTLREEITADLAHVEFRMVASPPPETLFADPPLAVGNGGADYAFADGGDPEPAFIGAGTQAAGAPRRTRPQLVGTGYDADDDAGASSDRFAAQSAAWAGTPRNAVCPCGSGKKFKHCHGRI